MGVFLLHRLRQGVRACLATCIALGLALGLSGAVFADGAPTLPPPVEILAERPELQQLYEAALRQDDAATWRELARAVFDAGDGDGAIPYFERVVTLQPDVRGLLDLALVYGNASRVGPARATYERLLKLQPNHAVARHNLGNLHANVGDYQRSILEYRKAIAARPDYLMAHAHLGDSYRQLEQFREAYLSYAKAVELEPRSPAELTELDDALYKMATLDIQMGAKQRGAQLLTELIQANPDHAKAHYALGRLLVELGRVDEAQRHLDRHLQLQRNQDRGGTAAMGQ